MPGLRSISRESRRPTFLLSTREDHIAPWQSTYAATQLYKGPIKFVLADLATSLASSAHLAVSMATGKTQTFPTARLNGSKPRTWFRPPGGRRGRNGYRGMPAVRSKHASPVDHCSRSRTHQAPMFVPVSIPLQPIKEIPINRTRTFCVTGFRWKFECKNRESRPLEFSERTAIAAANPWSVRARPKFGEFTVLVLKGIPFEIAFNTLPNRPFAAHEFLSSYLFVHLNVAARQFFYQFHRRIGQLLIFVRIAVLLKP